MTNELESLAERVREGIRKQGRYFVSAPAEMAQLGPLREAQKFAERHHWMLVSHMGETNYEFFEAIPSPRQKLF